MKYKILRYGSNGEGIAKSDDKVIFIPFALRDEEVIANITKEQNNYCFAQVSSILKPSLNRQEPECEYYNSCGGCDVMHAKYSEQLYIKSQIVKNNLQKYADYDGEILPIVESPKIKNYRNHITFAVSKKGQVGFYCAKTHNVVLIKKCLLADENINNLIDIFNDYFSKNNIKGYDFDKKIGEIKQIDVKFLDDQYLITINSTIKDLPNINELVEQILNLKKVFGLYVSVNSNANTLRYGELFHLYGEKSISAVENGIRSNISSYSFVQINNYIREKIYNNICEYIGNETVIDAYAGRAVLSALVAQKAKYVYCTEIIKSAVDDAKQMFINNGANNIEIICADAKNCLQIVDEKIDCIILDPPRKGVDKNILDDINKSEIKKIVYLSCSSNTLARDLKILMNKYKIISVQPYDMFPNTCNIEVLVFLERI